jgi:probable addiction module antidote protein
MVFPSPDSALPVLDTLESIAAYLGAAFDAGDADGVTRAMAVVAHAAALAELAAAAGVSRVQLAAALASGAMPFDTTLAVMKVIDLHRPPSNGWPNSS